MRNLYKTIVIINALFFLFSKDSFSQMFSWQIETVDAMGDVGDYASLGLDSYQFPHIAYYDWTNFILKYAKWNGSSWDIQTVDFVGDGSFFCALRIDSNNFPHISYQENGSANGNLKYAKWNGSSWDISVVDSTGNTGHDSSLALNSLNYPHISYCDVSNNSLKYAKWNGSSWDINTIDSSFGGFQHTSIILDSQGYAHISYRDAANRDLKYARFDGTTWNVYNIDAQGNVGIHPSIKLDSSDFPHISYGCDYSNGNLKYAYFDGTNWNIEIIDTAGLNYQTAISLDNNFNPCIAYYLGWNYYDLKYAKGIDIVAPATINDLSVTAGWLAGSINLAWTAPGDNGTSGNIINGTYQIEYSNDPNAVWGNSNNYSIQVPTNTIAGSNELFTIRDLNIGEIYYFWIRVADETPNWSQVSIRASGMSRLSTDFVLVNVYPRIFTPNGDGINDAINFVFENPKSDKIYGKIFDTLGSLIRDNLYQNSISSLIWDGKDNRGGLVKGGVYIYQIKAGRTVFNGTVILAK